MKRYNSTLIKMTRRLGMAIAALLMLSTMASCSDQDSQAPATGDEAYLNLSFSTASATTSRASRAGDIGKTMRLRLILPLRATFIASRYGCLNQEQKEKPSRLLTRKTTLLLLLAEVPPTATTR